MKTAFLSISLIIIIVHQSTAQSIAMYVAKDKATNSDIAYQIAWTCDWNAMKAAYDSLASKGYNNLYSRFSKQTNKGVYTIVKGKTKNTDGTERITYGMGVDSLPAASLEAAVKNLETSNWSWLPKYGYEVVQQSSFTTCEGKALVASYKIQPKGKGDTIVGFTAKEKAVNFKAKQIDPDAKLFRIPQGHSNVVVLELVFLNSANALNSEVKVLTAANESELENLIMLESVGNLDRNLQDIFIRYKSVDGKNVADSRSTMEKWRSKLQSLFIKTQAEICAKDAKRCEQLKKRKACMCVRG